MSEARPGLVTLVEEGILALIPIAEEMTVEHRDRIEQAMLRFSEECVRLRAVERALTGTHSETYRLAGALASRDCTCPIGHDHSEQERTWTP